MKRSFNYTERIKISQRAVNVRLYNDTDGVQVFDADINLSDNKNLPVGTKIYLEAYYRSALMRFEVGTFDHTKLDFRLQGKRLDDLQDPIVNFRVKLVDVGNQIGRLVGVIERVQVFNEDAKQVERIGLLPVNFGADLGHRVWDVQFSDNGDDPVLCINKNLNIENGTLREFVARDPAFVTLVFPEALHRILEQLTRDGVNLDDDESWQTKWARFAISYGGALPPDVHDPEQARSWIEQVLEAFCVHANIKTRFEDYLSEERL